jgi:hypothetical protein
MANELAQFLLDNHLKATSFELAEMFRELANPDSVSRGRPLQRIGELIDGELDNQQLLGKLPGNGSFPGSQPLDDQEISAADDTCLLKIVDVWGANENLEPITDTLLADMLEAYANAPDGRSTKKNEIGNAIAKLPLIIALTLAAVITAFAAYGALLLFGLV